MVFAIHSNSSAADSAPGPCRAGSSRPLLALLGALSMVVMFGIRGQAQSLEAISREVSVFNLGEPTASLEALSRELSLFNLGEASAANEAVSRELSVFNLGEPTAALEAISREFSVMNLGSNALSLEAISREVSLFNLGEPTAALEAISREVSVFMNTNPLPDLTVSILAAPAAALGGESVAVAFAITNRGPFQAEGPWTNHFLLATIIAGNDARLIGIGGLTNSLAAGDFLLVTQQVTLPLDAYGNLFLGVRVDGEGNVVESEEGNNEAFRAISLTYPPLPDLVVRTLEATNIASAGQPVSLAWSVTNAGPVIATAPWQERLLLADNPAGSNATPLLTWETSNSLPPASILQRTQTAILPAGLAGDFWFVMQADSAGQVFEGFGETNNFFISPQPVTVTAPDLQISLLNGPATAEVGQSFAVNWGVTNIGSGAAQVSWSDRVWLSPASNSISGATLLASVAADASPLALAGSYSTNAQVTVPLSAQSQAGSFWLIVQTDATSAQPESDEINNLRSQPITLTLPQLPDLAAGPPTAPASALPGQLTTLTWAITNLGTLGATGAWSETVFLATDSGGGGALELGTFRFTNSLAVGSYLLRTQAVALPVASPLGNTWFAVRVDSLAEVVETTETNNLTPATNTTVIPAVLTLQLSTAQVYEGAAQPLSAVLSRNGSRATPLSVTVSNSDPTELGAPTNVVIAAGQAAVAFNLFGLADGVVDGPQPVELLAQATGFNTAAAFVTVLDSDRPRLTVSLNTNVVTEGGTLIATVARDAGTNPVAVQIIPSSASQLLVPASVLVPAGDNAVSFAVQAVNDTLVEAPAEYSLTLNAAGHVSDGTSLFVQDDDVPLVLIDVLADSVSEGAGPQATTVTLTRSFVGARPLNVALRSSDTNAALVPAQVTIPAGTLSISIPLAAVNDTLVNPTRQVDVSGSVLATGVNTVVAEAISDSLFVTDDDGPALKVTLARDLVAEGLNPATTGTVSRNNGTNGALLVSLASSDTTEVTLPAGVTIPAGTDSATFTLVTPADGTNDGNQIVTVTASAPGFTNGNTLLTVSDINLPDLIVRSVSAPASAETEAFVNLGYQLLNQGLSTMASNAILQRIYLSSDRLVGDDLLMGQFSFNGSLPPGDQIGQTFQLRLPQAAGDYWVVVETDAGDAVPEILENNNVTISATPIHVAAAYGAVVSTTLTTAPAGTPVPLTGHATNGVGGPAASVLVNLHIKVRGTHRVISALTDSQGDFRTTWQPLVNEAGFYEIAAGHPGEADPATQDMFTLLGMKANPESLALTVIEHGTNTGLIEVRNLSAEPLTGLTVAVQSQPANVQATVALFPLPGGEGQGGGGPATNLLGLATNYLRYAITAQDTSIAQGTVSIRISSAEGATLDIPIAVKVQSLVPRLVSDPPELVTGMKRGAQRLVNFSVANVGGAASGPISVSLPDVPWMHVVNPNPLSSLAPGQSNTITLQLTPPADLPLTTFEGVLALNAANAGLTVPFKIRALSEARGDLKITAVDEYTYYAEGSPKVTNATVVIKDALSGELIVTNGLTDANGEFFATNLVEGYYVVEVAADRHTTYHDTHLFVAGMTNDVSAFLSRETVQYTWTVVPSEIPDRYRITIETTFETEVPVPVVTVDPPVLDVGDLTTVGQVKQLNLTIRNHGLIAAQDAKISFGSHPFYEIKPLIEQVGVLPARSSLTVPVTLRRIGDFSTIGNRPVQARGERFLGRPAVPCSMGGVVNYGYLCGSNTVAKGEPLAVSNVEGDCSRGGGPVVGEGGPVGGGGGGGRGTISSIGFSPLNLCDCSFFDDICLCKKEEGCETGFNLNGLADKLAEIIKNRLPVGIIVTPSIRVSLSGNLCTCCVNGSLGLTGNIRGEAEITLEAVGGFHPEIPEDPGEAGEWVGISVSGDLLLGVEGNGSGKVSFNLQRRCGGEVSWCASGSLMLELFGGTKGNMSVSAHNKPLDTDFSGSVDGEIGLNGSVSAFIRECSSAGLKVMACGELETTFKFNGELTGTVQGQSTNKEFHFDRSVPLLGGCVVGKPELDVPSGHTYASRSEIGPTESFIPAEEFLRSDAYLFEQVPGYRAQAQGVCAKVRLRLDQDAVLARDAFKATLEVFNNDPVNALTNFTVALGITDDSGHDLGELFGITNPQLIGFDAVNGAGRLPASSGGRVIWTLIPTTDAAPTLPRQYLVGGMLSYTQAGQQVNLPLAPISITVLPSPRLSLHYFHQRDVFSDDPFTDAIEPSVPYSLAVMVQNKGFGVAKNFHITSAQPQIVENEKGLLADFKIIATEVAGQNLTPSLTADFGTIDPGGIAIGRWLMTSTIQGLFIDYSATFEHLDGLGNKKLSLIDDVSIHEMNHLVQAGGVFADGKPDFLVNDLPDLNDYPDTLYLSDGTTNRVEVVTHGMAGGILSPGNLSVPFTAPMPGGWAYLRVPDPADGQYRLKAIVRSDGTNLLADNFWTTDRTFIGLGRRPIRENILHLLDYNSTGGYTLEYELNPALDVEPPSSSVTALPANSRAQFPVNWSGADNAGGSGMSFFDVYVSEDGGAFRRWLWETIDTSAMYQGSFGKTYSFYSVAVDRAGNREPAPGAPDAQTTVTLTNHPPVLAALDDVTIPEGQTLLLNVTASDPDEDSLIFSLVGSPPAGLFLNPYSGLLTWATGEVHGPSTNPVTVQVLDSGAPRLGTTRSFTIFVTDDNAPPVLTPIAHRAIAEGFLLAITNTAKDFDLPTQKLTFSLGPGAPTNASINKTTGVFTWRPTELQGGTTNHLSVIVTDDGEPPLSATQTFSVIVWDTRPDFTLTLGTTQLLAGATSWVPLQLQSGSDLTNIQLVLTVNSDRLTNLNLQALAPEVAAANFQALGSNRFNLTFRSRTDATLQGNLPLAQLAFDTLTNAPSSVARLTGESLQGDRASNPVPLTGAAVAGRVFVLAREPILETLRDPGNRLQLVLYAVPHRNYLIERASVASQPAPWVTDALVTPTALRTLLPPRPMTDAAEFFRAMAWGALRIRSVGNSILVEWPLGCSQCVLEESPQLGAAAHWTRVALPPSEVNGHYQVLLPATGTQRFLRLALPELGPTDLNIQLVGTNVVVEWSLSCANCVLEGTAELGASAQWIPVGVTPTVVNGRYQVILPVSGANRFLRLTSL